MEYGRREFVEQLVGLSGERGVGLSEEQAELCFEHVKLMLEWNRTTNLTRITDMREILVKHLLDSLIPALWVPHETGLSLDVGAGAGFPGVPLKVLRPGLDMVLLDSSRKKVSFLRVLLARLGLRGIRAAQGRWEDLDGLEGGKTKGPYRLITMRAVRLEANHLKTLASGSLEPGGIFAWWSGPGEGKAETKEEAAGALSDTGEMEYMGCRDYRLPWVEASRRLLLWRLPLRED